MLCALGVPWLSLQASHAVPSLNSPGPWGALTCQLPREVEEWPSFWAEDLKGQTS